MAGVPVKFRCYQCNRLLGVSHSKIGAVVSCPKCGAELIVPPAGGELAGADDVTNSTSPLDPPAGSRDVGGASFDFLDIRPEDIRVEPGADRIPYSPPRETRPPAEEVPIFVRETPPTPSPAAPPVLPPPAPPLVIPKSEEPSGEIIPPIRLEGSRPSLSRASLPVRNRDVVLPRSAVATWCLFVLLAQALAFLAGLLAGHFLWRVH